MSIPDEDPGKAYLVTYTVTNKVEGVIHASSAREARAKLRAGDYDQGGFEATGQDGRTGGVTVRRYPDGDQ